MLVLLEELLLRIKTGVGVVCGKLLELCGMPLCANEKLHLNGGIGRVDRTLVDQALLDLLASDQLRLSTSVSALGEYQPNIFEIYERLPDMAISGTY